MYDFIHRDINALTSTEIKTFLLSHGVRLSESFISNYGSPFLEKRRAYGNSDPSEFRDIAIPQELYLLPEKTICAVNIRIGSQWILDYKDETFLLRGPSGFLKEITFPKRPSFYDQIMTNGKLVKNVATLYGGGSIGIFINGSCSLVTLNRACQYCSIKQNHDKTVDFIKLINPDDVYEAAKIALQDQNVPATQVMLNGGNFPKSDRGFKIYTEVCKAARAAINDVNSDADLHLIAYPPNNTRLFEELAALDISIAMNTEVYDRKLFSEYCPGKDADLIFKSLKNASEILGIDKVFSIFVGGLEPVESMKLGFERLAGIGVTPIINVFHADPGTALANRLAPSVAEISAMGKLLQKTYQKNNFMRPFYMGCGRNAIDTEAYLGMF